MQVDLVWNASIIQPEVPTAPPLPSIHLGLCNGEVSETEYSSLFDLFFSTDGANWRWDRLLPDSTHWTFPAPLSAPCGSQWQGINCSYVNESLAIAMGGNCSSSGEGSPCCSIETLMLADRRLSGTLPASIGNLTMTAHMYLCKNSLTGTIPSQFGYATSLNSLFLYSNYLTGTIPPELSLLTEIQVLEMYQNSMTGSIPSDLGLLANVQVLGLVYNYFTGTIPSEFGNLRSLEYLYLYCNTLSGTIPTELGNLQRVYYFGVSTNLLTGHVPSSIGSLSYVTIFAIDTNSLSGTLPTEIGLLGATLENFEVFTNKFTGTVPTQLGMLSAMTDLLLYDNSFTGPLPTQIGKLIELRYIATSNNMMSGSIPSELSTLGRLEAINFDFNMFDGHIPMALQRLKNLRSFGFDSNLLSGTLPPQVFRNWTKIQLINGSSNLFTGNVEGIFDISDSSEPLFGSLQSLELSSNSLTGTIPPALFQLTELIVVALFSNCFSGSLPDTLCDATAMTTLILDSLSSAPACNVQVPAALRPVLRGVFPKRFLTGSIPHCVWSMPRLETLHLSGNGLYGSLGDLSSSSLVDVSLDNNNLVGSIPSSFQMHGRFKQLLLANNKLSGTLQPTFQALNSSEINAKLSTNVLDLTNNRLSGDIPSVLEDAYNIDILTGNLFQCRANNKPSHDPSSPQYVCGSNDLDISLLLTLGVLVLVIICGLVMRYSESSAKWRASTQSSDVADSRAINSAVLLEANSNPVSSSSSSDDSLRTTLVTRRSMQSVLIRIQSKYFSDWMCFEWHVTPSNARLMMTYRFVYAALRLSRCLGWLAALYVGLALTSYIVLKSSVVGSYIDASTHTFQYTWITTSAYLHGLVAASVVVFFLFASVGALSVTLKEMKSCSDTPPPDKAQSSTPGVSLSTDSVNRTNQKDKVETLHHEPSASNIFCANPSHVALSMLMQLINIVITLIVNIAYVYTTLQGLSPVALSVVQFMLGVYKIVWVNGVMSLIIRKLGFLTPPQQLMHRSFMSMFTFVAGPFLATFFSDPSCFLYVVTRPSPVVSSFSLSTFNCVTNCVTYVGCILTCGFDVGSEIQVNTDVTPGWLYSFQCSSALLSNYVPVLVLSFLISGIVVPALNVLYLHLPYRFVTAWTPTFVYNALFKDTIFVFVRDLDDGSAPSAAGAGGGSFRMSEWQQEVERGTFSHQLERLRQRRPLFNSTVVVTRFMLNLALMLTFGLASPLLAILVALDAFALAWLWRWLIGRYILLHGGENDSKENNENHNPTHLLHAYNRLEVATLHSSEGVRRAFYMVLAFASLFWGLGMFDMVGDVYGRIVGGFAVLVPLVGSALFFWLCESAHVLSSRPMAQWCRGWSSGPNKQSARKSGVYGGEDFSSEEWSASVQSERYSVTELTRTDTFTSSS